MTKISGIKAITTKSGNKGFEYHLAESFSEYDKEHTDCYGNQVFTGYIHIYGKGFIDKSSICRYVHCR